MADRLKNATSPYLRQHADNPVDWWPWSDEAFEQARHRDVPVLLSVGYSACHWCHVMAHESFEDETTAELMNENLVSIKVDREERPDVDAVYMAATQGLTGSGGWPMTVFLSHDKEPFYCGTYFPREQFQRLVLAVAKAWRENRAAVGAQARDIAQALAETAASARVAPGGNAISPEITSSAVTGLARRYDRKFGGFGGAPKFPPSSVLEFLLRHAERGGQSGAGGGQSTADQAGSMAAETLQAMARGGIYDQLGGGFARYSTDARWIVPHFEKMLYDNAQLARVYAHWWRRSDSALARRVAEQTCDFMLAELRTPEGGFASALDADSDGVEGAFYVWTPEEIADALPPDDAEYARTQFAVTTEGTFEHGSSVLQLPADPADPQRFERVRSALLETRSKRVRPGRDDKVVAAWNGLAIAALAEAGLLFGRPEYIKAAAEAAGLVASVHCANGRLVRTSLAGVPGASQGVLDDYACVSAGFIALAGVSGEGRWVRLAGELLEVAVDRFGGQDGFYDTADDAEELIYRPADPADGPTPSGTFALAGALLSYAALTGSTRLREAASVALAPLPQVAERYPQAAGSGLVVAEAFLAGPAEIAVVGPPEDERTAELHRAALLAAPPGAVLALGPGDRPDGSAGASADGSSGAAADGIPLLAGRAMVDGKPAAYVCRNFACQMPVTTPEDLRTALHL